MLTEEQAAELLRSCERIAGRELRGLRGRLKSPEGRLAAVWEMLVVDAAAQLGTVEYESPAGGPDIRLKLPTGRWVWIEASFLQDHQSRPVARGIRAALERHAVFRKLRSKRQQHKVDGPRLVCIGGDKSPALSPLVARTTVSHRDAAFAAFRKTGALAGALVVRIARERAEAIACVNGRARSPLTEAEWNHLLRLDFNRWRLFSRSLEDQERIPASRLKQATGTVSARLPYRGGNMTLRVPGPLLLEALTQDKSLARIYGSGHDDPIPKLLSRGWRVVGCAFIAGSVEEGNPSTVEIELAPSHEPVYWPPDTRTDGAASN